MLKKAVKKVVKKAKAKAKPKAAAKPKATVKAKAKPHNWRQLEREAQDAKERKALKARLQKRGSYEGSPH